MPRTAMLYINLERTLPVAGVEVWMLAQSRLARERPQIAFEDLDLAAGKFPELVEIHPEVFVHDRIPKTDQPLPRYGGMGSTVTTAQSTCRLAELEHFVGDSLVRLFVRKEGGATRGDEHANPLDGLKHVRQAQGVGPHTGTASAKTVGRMNQ